MKDLSQLRAAISELPCVFANDKSDFDVSSEGAVCLENGFPAGYSRTTDRKDILLEDMNRVGALATRELHYRQTGGQHYFTDNGESLGYSKGALLSYWDGFFLKKLESQFAENNIDYLVNAECIDGLWEKNEGETTKIWWKSSEYVFGIARSLVSAGGNFSNAKSLTIVHENPEDPESPEIGVVEEDALVSVGDYIYGQYVSADDPFGPITISDQLKNMIATMKIVPPEGDEVNLNLPCKGRNGLFVAIQGLLLWTTTFPAELCGNSNFDLCFFAKAGTKIKCELKANEKENTTSVPPTPTKKDISRIKYYPLTISVKEDVDEAV